MNLRLIFTIPSLFLIATVAIAQSTSQSGTNALPLLGKETYGLGGKPGDPPAKDKPKTIRYAEYQAQCLDEDYSDFEMLPENIKQKRLKLLADKISLYKKNSDEKNLKMALKLQLDEFLKQKMLKEFSTSFSENQLQLTEEERIYYKASLDLNKQIYVDTKKSLDLALEKFPSSVKIKEKLADAFSRLQNYSESVEIYKELDKKNSTKKYLELICRNYVKSSDHANIEKTCQQLKSAEPNNYRADVYLGISKRDQELYAKAKLYFEQSIKVKPSEFAYSCLGEIEVLLKNYDQAIEAFSQAIKLVPQSARAQLGLAMVYKNRFEYDKALSHFEKSCELGNKPMREFGEVLKVLKETKNPLQDKYFSVLHSCKQKSN